MTRLPVWPTLVVAMAVATMLALGVWQYGRIGEKEALIATFAANRTRPAIAYPAMGPVADTSLYRRSAALCLRVTGWRTVAGRAADGRSGYRLIAECATGAEGPGLLAVMGVRPGPGVTPPDWRGGPVSGIIVTEPEQRSFLGRAFGRADTPLRPMLVADRPAPGLLPNAMPDPNEVPNNHRAYAVQWFLFAAIAAIIYIVALRRRARP